MSGQAQIPEAGGPGQAQIPEARTKLELRAGVGAPEGRSRMSEVEAA